VTVLVSRWTYVVKYGLMRVVVCVSTVVSFWGADASGIAMVKAIESTAKPIRSLCSDLRGKRGGRLVMVTVWVWGVEIGVPHDLQNSAFGTSSSPHSVQYLF